MFLLISQIMVYENLKIGIFYSTGDYFYLKLSNINKLFRNYIDNTLYFNLISYYISSSILRKKLLILIFKIASFYRRRIGYQIKIYKILM